MKSFIVNFNSGNEGSFNSRSGAVDITFLFGYGGIVFLGVFCFFGNRCLDLRTILFFLFFLARISGCSIESVLRKWGCRSVRRDVGEDRGEGALIIVFDWR